MEKRNDFASGSPSVNPLGNTWKVTNARDEDKNRDRLGEKSKYEKERRQTEKYGTIKNFTKLSRSTKLKRDQQTIAKEKIGQKSKRVIPVNRGFSLYIRI